MQSLQELKGISQLSREKKKHHKIVFLGKDKLNTIEDLISNALFDIYIGHKEFFSVNHVLRYYNEMKEEIKNPGTSVEYGIIILYYHTDILKIKNSTILIIFQMISLK